MVKCHVISCNNVTWTSIILIFTVRNTLCRTRRLFSPFSEEFSCKEKRYIHQLATDLRCTLRLLRFTAPNQQTVDVRANTISPIVNFSEYNDRSHVRAIRSEVIWTNRCCRLFLHPIRPRTRLCRPNRMRYCTKLLSLARIRPAPSCILV